MSSGSLLSWSQVIYHHLLSLMLDVVQVHGEEEKGRLWDNRIMGGCLLRFLKCLRMFVQAQILLLNSQVICPQVFPCWTNLQQVPMLSTKNLRTAASGFRYHSHFFSLTSPCLTLSNTQVMLPRPKDSNCEAGMSCCFVVYGLIRLDGCSE